MKAKIIFIIVSLALILSSCASPQPEPTAAPSATSIPLTETPLPTAIPTLIPSVEILARECSVKDLGRIVYIDRSTSPDALYLMSGDGCCTKWLMNDPSDSPEWAPNGKTIAVGCEDDTRICLLAPTDPATNEFAIRERIALPEECAQGWINSVSWAPDMEKLAVVCGKDQENDILYIASLMGEKDYRIILRAEEISRAVWSPVGNYIAVSVPPDIFLIASDGQNKTRLASGWSPEWAPDGSKIAYVREADEFVTGVAAINPDGKDLGWLLPPARQFAFDTSESRHDSRLAWSPDGRYLAFGSMYFLDGPTYNWQIFRLDLQTGGVMLLTWNDYKNRFYFEPDWGP